MDFWDLGIKGFDLFGLKVPKASVHYVKNLTLSAFLFVLSKSLARDNLDTA